MGTPSHVDCLDVARRLRIRALKLHNNIIEGILMEEYTVHRREMKNMDKFAVMIAKDKRRDGLAHSRCVTESMFDVLLEMARETSAR